MCWNERVNKETKVLLSAQLVYSLCFAENELRIKTCSSTASREKESSFMLTSAAAATAAAILPPK